MALVKYGARRGVDTPHHAAENYAASVDFPLPIHHKLSISENVKGGDELDRGRMVEVQTRAERFDWPAVLQADFQSCQCSLPLGFGGPSHTNFQNA